MELIRVVKRGLKADGEGLADKYVKQLLINEVLKLQMSDNELVIKRIKETYDSGVIVNSLQLISKENIDEALRAYLNYDAKGTVKVKIKETSLEKVKRNPNLNRKKYL